MRVMTLTARALASSMLTRLAGRRLSEGRPLPHGQRLLSERSTKPAARVVAILADLEVGPELHAVVEGQSGSVHVIAPEARPAWDLSSSAASFHVATTLDEVNWVLKMIGPADLIINMTTKTALGHEKDWDRLFFNLRKGGEYVIPRDRIGRDEEPGIFERLVKVMAAQSAPSAVLKTFPAGIRAFTDAVATGRLDAESIRVGKANQHLAKIRDADGSRMMAVRGRQLTVRDVVTLPPLTFEHRGQVISHEAQVSIPDLDTTFTVPALKLRHYEGRIGMVSNALLFSEEMILPDSFRHHRTPGLINPAVTNVNRDFALIPERVLPHTSRPGTFYHLDCENSGHYGHLVTEVMSRLWGWEQAKRDTPGLQAVFRIRYPNERDPLLERRLFTAFGIGEADITWTAEPTWLESVYAATPMWHNAMPHYVHPDIQDIWQRVSRGLTRSVERDQQPSDRLFVSRRAAATNRSCRNAREVEAVFAEYGFTVIYPEELDLAQQAYLFRDARVVAGFGGSGLFNIFNSKALEHLVVLNHESYTARNEHLYAAVLGCTEHYFWSPADIAHPTNGWSADAYYSGWEFDFERNLDQLTRLLRSL
jgi:capsular polysaccharide biosynthesis protein